MNIDFIKKMELEITSDCNASCPCCARTQNLHRLEVTRFSLDDLKRILPDERHIRDKDISLCGVLGDPMIHPQVVDITEYLLSNGAQVTISTNAGIAPIETWEKLGKRGGKLIFSEIITEYRDQNNELVITATMVGVSTERAATSTEE